MGGINGIHPSPEGVVGGGKILVGVIHGQIFGGLKILPGNFGFEYQGIIKNYKIL